MATFSPWASEVQRAAAIAEAHYQMLVSDFGRCPGRVPPSRETVLEDSRRRSGLTFVQVCQRMRVRRHTHPD